MNNNQVQISTFEELDFILKNMSPWLSNLNSNILQEQTKDNTQSYLDEFYLYPVYEFCVDSECDDIPKFINERFQVLYSAASNSGITVALIIQSKAGKIQVSLGLKSKEGNINKEHFTSLLNGIIPSKKINYEETESLSSMCKDHKFGGVVSGIPTIKIEDEKQRINISSVIRSLYGKDYILSIISEPVDDIQKENAFFKLLDIRDKLHRIANQTVSLQKGSGTSYGTNESETQGSSQGTNQSETKGTSQGTNQSETKGTSQGTNKSETKGTSQGTNQSETKGTSQGISQSKTSGTSSSTNQSTSVSSSVSTGFNFFGLASGQAEVSVSGSSGTSFSESQSNTQGISSSQNQSNTRGTSSSQNQSNTRGTSSSQNQSKTEGTSSSQNQSNTEGTSSSQNQSNTRGTSETTSENQSQSLSMEQQNGIAVELEKIADQCIQRYKQGFNAGFWETTITFSASEKITCDILGGAMLGELSKPSDNLLQLPRYYVDELKDNQSLFLPKDNPSNLIFPKSLASYITSEELSVLASTPTKSIPGFEITKMPSLALTDTNQGDYTLGSITDHGNSIPNAYISISKKDLNKHLFVGGLTGSGKTTTVKSIIKNLTVDKIPFLILESAKRDYRQLLADDSFKDMKIFTIGDSTVSPIRFNPFYIQKGVHPLVHIDYLKALFNASFSLYGPMPHILEKCLNRIYTKKGWNLTTGTHPHFLTNHNEFDEMKYAEVEHYYFYPTLADLKSEVEHYISKEMDYKGELRDNIKTAIISRIESLCVGAKGLMFNTYDFYSIETLLNQSIIFEMENLADDDDKAFFVGLILVLTSEFRQKDNPAINPGKKDLGLQHFMVIEEAHRLLKNVNTEKGSEMMGNPKGKAVEVFCNVIAEMRSLGQGCAVVEQIPSKISPDVIKNSNMKIVHRLVSRDDQSLLAGSLGIDDNEALYLNRLKTGHALFHKEGMAKPVECFIKNNFTSYAKSDKTVSKLMQNQSETLHPFQVYEISEILNEKGKNICLKLLRSIIVAEESIIKELFEEATLRITAELQKLNFNHEIEKNVLVSYVCKEIINLFTSGEYCLKSKLPKGFVKNLNNLFSSFDSSSILDFKKQLKEIWKVLDIKNHIFNELIKEINQVIRARRRENKKQNITEQYISNYFLVSPNLVIKESITKIKESLDNNGNI